MNELRDNVPEVMSRIDAPCHSLFLEDVEDVKREDDDDRNA